MDGSYDFTDEQLCQLTTQELRRLLGVLRNKHKRLMCLGALCKGELIPLVKAQYDLDKIIKNYPVIKDVRKCRLRRDKLITNNDFVDGDLVLKVPQPPPPKIYDYFVTALQKRQTEKLKQAEQKIVQEYDSDSETSKSSSEDDDSD